MRKELHPPRNQNASEQVIDIYARQVENRPSDPPWPSMLPMKYVHTNGK